MVFDIVTIKYKSICIILSHSLVEYDILIIKNTFIIAEKIGMIIKIHII